MSGRHEVTRILIGIQVCGPFKEDGFKCQNVASMNPFEMQFL